MNVLVVGSSSIDLFLEVADKTHINISSDKLLLNLGDKIPTDIKKIAVGGNGANVSVGLQRLTLNTSFYTFFGRDLFSRELEEVIKNEGVNLLAQRVGEKSSISLIYDFDSDRIIFSHHEKRDHSFQFSGEKPDFIYLTSLGNDWEKAYSQVLEYATQNNIPLGFNPGSHQMAEKTKIVLDIIKACEIVFINKEEAKKILGWLKEVKDDSIKDLLLEFKNLGSKIVSITDGANGAYLYNGEKYYWIGQFGKDGQEKTGAGDAYASGFLAKYLMQGDLADCMKWGPINADSVTKEIGAQQGLLTLDKMNKILEGNLDFRAVEI